MKDKELLECPCCGRKDFKLYTIGADNHREDMIICINSRCMLWHIAFKVRYWNTRASDKRLDEIVEEIESEVRACLSRIMMRADDIASGLKRALEIINKHRAKN